MVSLWQQNMAWVNTSGHIILANGFYSTGSNFSP
jgi:hypothetical protein